MPSPHPCDERAAHRSVRSLIATRPIGGLTAAVVLGAAIIAGCGGSAPSDSSPAGPDPQHRGPQGNAAQFIVRCTLSHVAFDDPIVLPDQPGESHQHYFFGNDAVDATPDYDAVSGATTSCAQRLDTASYWAPALLDASGAQVEPVGMTAYYRPGPGVDPADVVAYPPGLMLIGGDAHAEQAQSTDVVAWSCGTSAAREVEPPTCPANSKLRMLVTFPACWDGEHLVSDDAGHTADQTHAVYGTDGCPASHPVAVPQLQVTIDYPPVDPEGLSLASGSILSGHADFWNVWDQDKLEGEVADCLNRDLVCGVSG